MLGIRMWVKLLLDSMRLAWGQRAIGLTELDTGRRWLGQFEVWHRMRN